MQTLEKVDHSALKINQLMIITLNIIAFLINLPWLAALTALAMGLGSLLKRPGFGFLYSQILKPRGWMKPDVLEDNPEPHRFAQFLGFIFMAGGSVLLFTGFTAGWILVWTVTALAALNVFGGFCVGCAIYYQLAIWKIPGFSKQPITNTLPGFKPNAGAKS